jgi:ribonuclease HI
MSQKPQKTFDIIDLYVDGSASKRLHRLGLGWVISSVHTDKPVIQSYGVTYEKGIFGHERALIAEFMAATFALRDLPKGSKVRLHTDHTEVAKILSDYDAWRNIAMNNKIRDTRIERIAEVLHLVAQNHQLVEVIVTNDRVDDPVESKMMREAHNAAISVSGSQNYKYPRQSNCEALENPPITWPPKVGGHDPQP